jgi:DNA-binding transcriptional MerR regulator
MKDKQLISQLASTYGISRPTLLYYDTIGLLVPSQDKKTGYRYYSKEDQDNLELILLLKETGLSLNKIKEFLNNPSLKSNIHLLQLKKIELHQKILELQNLEHSLDHKISQLLSNKK